MMSKSVQILTILLLGTLFLIVSAQGAISTISAGNTVFLGEQGLDISPAMGSVDTKIGWWASGADIRGSAPTQTIDVSSRMNSFMVSPSEFSGYPGNWYRLDSSGSADGIAFNVADPQIDLRVEDTTVTVDVTDKWVPTGDVIRFRIETNLAQINSQRSSPALITIKVQPPSGGEYSSLINSAGTPVSIVDIPISSTPYTTDSIWDTGNRANYAPGSYRIWAECNTNKMKDNYEQTGKTISRKISLLNQDQNPLIGSKVQTTAPTTTATTKLTTRATTVPVTTTPPTTTITTPQITSPTVPPTTVQTTVEPSTPVTSVPVSPSPTKTPGFEFVLAGISLIIGAIVYCKRN